MRVLVLGHRGVLGKEVLRYFSAHTIEERYYHTSPEYFLHAAADIEPRIVINCVVEKSPVEQIEVNALLPLRLRLHLPDAILVQPSTDAVFCGDRGQYRVTEPPDARTLYGQTKALGELVANYPRTIVVRASITDGRVPVAFVNWYWNGVTTREWCKAVEELLHEGFTGLCHVATDKVITKLELASLVGGITEEQHLPMKRDLSLVPTHVRMPIELQLRELLNSRRT